jgi:RimJ/RimL family protein N-acetyltransferase
MNPSKEIQAEFETPRLRLRPLTGGDGKAFFDIFSDPETMQYWSGSPVSDQAEADALLKREFELSGAGNFVTWGITLPQTNRVIGKFTLFQFSEQNRRAEVGYILARRYWGQGYMSEVMHCLIDYSFGALGLHRLEADTDPANTGSLALLKKFGFIPEGLFRQRWLIGGQWMDSVMLGLLREDYRHRFPASRL